MPKSTPRSKWYKSKQEKRIIRKVLLLESKLPFFLTQKAKKIFIMHSAGMMGLALFFISKGFIDFMYGPISYNPYLELLIVITTIAIITLPILYCCRYNGKLTLFSAALWISLVTLMKYQLIILVLSIIFIFIVAAKSQMIYEKEIGKPIKIDQ